LIEKTKKKIQKIKNALNPVKNTPVTQPATDKPFDSVAWDKAREDRIKASRAAGNTHLDKVPPYVESMRGKSIYSAHDPKERGIIRTVDNRGNVYVNWSDEYSAKKNSASASMDGKKQVFQTSLGTTDLKDYVLGNGEAPIKGKQPATSGVPEAGAGATQPPQAAPDEFVKVGMATGGALLTVLRSWIRRSRRSSAPQGGDDLELP
jgi:hypothetical protein